MTRSILAPLAVVALAATVVLGCGGGGGKGGTSSSGSANTTGNATYAVTKIVGVDPSGATLDFFSIPAGQSLAVRTLLVNRATGVGTLVGVDGLSTTAPSGVATVDAAAGTFSAFVEDPTRYSVRGKFNGKSLSSPLVVTSPAGLVRVTGRARTPSGGGVAGAVVSFLASSGETLATATVGPTGTFAAYVPTAAVRFDIDVSALKVSTDADALSLYYNSYSYDYNGQNPYFGAMLSCPAPLPTLSGSAVALPVDIVFFPVSSGGGAPPPPSGCFGS